jgi:hypothetical protein
VPPPTLDFSQLHEALKADLRAQVAMAAHAREAPQVHGHVAAADELDAARARLVGRPTRLVDVTDARAIGGAAGSTATVDALGEHRGDEPAKPIALQELARIGGIGGLLIVAIQRADQQPAIEA